MAELKQIYKCAVYGNVVEVLDAGSGKMVCCGQVITSMAAKTTDDGAETHVPVIAQLPANVCHCKDGVTIKVGAVKHPMTPEHHIEWIEIITADGKAGKKFLKAGEKPESDFYTRINVVGARAYCNVHGLWEMKNASN